MGSEPNAGAEPIAELGLQSPDAWNLIPAWLLGVWNLGPAYRRAVNSKATGIPTISYFTSAYGASLAT
jgi:hypothetical protein